MKRLFGLIASIMAILLAIAAQADAPSINNIPGSFEQNFVEPFGEGMLGEECRVVAHHGGRERDPMERSNENEETQWKHVGAVYVSEYGVGEGSPVYLRAARPGGDLHFSW